MQFEFLKTIINGRTVQLVPETVSCMHLCTDCQSEFLAVYCGAGALQVTVSRISGICIGVGVSLLLSIVVYPSSASVKAMACLRQVSTACSTMYVYPCGDSWHSLACACLLDQIEFVRSAHTRVIAHCSWIYTGILILYTAFVSMSI